MKYTGPDPVKWQSFVGLAKGPLDSMKSDEMKSYTLKRKPYEMGFVVS